MAGEPEVISCEQEIGLSVGSRLKSMDLFSHKIVGAQSRIGGVLSAAAVLLTLYFVCHTAAVYTGETDVVAQSRAARPLDEPLELPPHALLWELLDAGGRPVPASASPLSLEALSESAPRGGPASSLPAPATEGACSLPPGPDGSTYADGLSCFERAHTLVGSPAAPRASRLRLRFSLRASDGAGVLAGYELRLYAVTQPGPGWAAPSLVESRRVPLSRNQRAHVALSVVPRTSSSLPTLTERAATLQFPLAAVESDLFYSPADWSTATVVADVEIGAAAHRIEETVRPKTATPLILGWAAFWTLMTITLGAAAAAYNRHSFSRIGLPRATFTGGHASAGGAPPAQRPSDSSAEAALARELEALGDKLARERYRDMVPSSKNPKQRLVFDVGSGLAGGGAKAASPTLYGGRSAAQVALGPKFDELGGKQVSPRPSVHKARQHLESARKESRYSPATLAIPEGAPAPQPSSFGRAPGAAAAARLAEPPPRDLYPPSSAAAHAFGAPPPSNSASYSSSASSTMYRDPGSLYGTYSGGHGGPGAARRAGYRPAGTTRSPRESRSNTGTDASGSDNGGWLSQDGYGSDGVPPLLGAGAGPTAFSRVGRGPQPASYDGPPAGRGMAPPAPRFDSERHAR